MCNKCNNNCNECECTCKNNCSRPQCECAVKLASDCITVDNGTFECSGIENGLTLTQFLESYDEFVCNKFDLLAGFFTILNVGTGAGVYKGVNGVGSKLLRSLTTTESITITENTDEITFSVNPEWLDEYLEENNPNCIISDSIIITNEGSCTRLELPSSSLLNIYVNQSYIPRYEEFLLGKNKGEGTLARPFTNTIVYTTPTTFTITPNSAVQNALDAYVGNGTRGLDAVDTKPERAGDQIIIQNSNSNYVFQGDFNYWKLDIKFEQGVSFVHNPLTSEWLQDLDLFSNDNYFSTKLFMEANSLLELVKNGFRNHGSTFNGSNFSSAKQININGDNSARIVQTNTTETDSTIYTAIESNFNSVSGYGNDSLTTFDIRNISIMSKKQTLIKIGAANTGIGQGLVVNFDNVGFTYGEIGQNIITTAKPFKFSGTVVARLKNCNFYFYGNQIVDAAFEVNNRADIRMVAPLLNGVVGNLFHNISTTQKPIISVVNSTTLDVIYVGEIGEPAGDIFKSNLSSGKWDTIYFNNNFITSGNIDYDKIDLVALYTGTLNFINNQLVYNLPKLDTAGAEAALGKGALYINTTGNVLTVVPTT